MQTSVRWINDYLDRPATAEEIADGLTRAGFPLDGREERAGDICLEIETTSNRGDCLCHVGLARELAAMSGRKVKFNPSRPVASGPAASSLASVENREHGRCPLYTGRIIRGVKVGPSPAWLADRLRAIGQIPRNNVVDATNFVLFELGQPTHVFDLATLKGARIIVRCANPGEPFQPLGDGAPAVKLTTDDLVIADAERPVALAGVKGGALTAVTESTTDLLLEAATFAPASVRRSSRRHAISSDSNYRFERGVHPATIAAAADRLAELILQIAGGQLCDGVLSAGAELPPERTVSLRPARCRALLGREIADAEIIRSLTDLGFHVEVSGDTLRCRVPAARIDIEREVDLIEEICRMSGLDKLPLRETIAVRVAPAQTHLVARRLVQDLLVSQGFIECVTHSLVSDAAADAFLPPGSTPLRTLESRTMAEPALRPSIIPSLLRVRKHNQDHGVSDLKLFEVASTFRRDAQGHVERPSLGMIVDGGNLELGIRPLRGAIERVARAMSGPDVEVAVAPLPDGAISWLTPAGEVRVDGRPIGVIGVVTDAARRAAGVDQSLLAAELDLRALTQSYPPDTQVHPLPDRPAIERDISAIVSESTAWNDIEELIDRLGLQHLEQAEFVTVYRGKNVGPGRKSVTLRLRFRASDRTLRHEEVDLQMTQAMAALRDSLKAEIRS